MKASGLERKYSKEHECSKEALSLGLNLSSETAMGYEPTLPGKASLITYGQV